jgi:hypothetical protein
MTLSQTAKFCAGGREPLSAIVRPTAVDGRCGAAKEVRADFDAHNSSSPCLWHKAIVDVVRFIPAPQEVRCRPCLATLLLTEEYVVAAYEAELVQKPYKGRVILVCRMKVIPTDVGIQVSNDYRW